MVTNRFYNYVYLDPTKEGEYKYKLSNNTEIIFNNEPFYIGKGTKKRYLDHIKYEYLCCGFMKNKLKSLKNNNIVPIIKLLNNDLTNEEVINYEIELIKYIGKRIDNKGPLVNLTNGGEGFNGYKHNKETILKISNSKKNRPKTINELNHYKRLKELNTNSHRGISFGVKQIDKTTNLIIKEFRTLREASKETNIPYSNIGECCLNKRKSAGGYKWSYINNK